MEVSSGDTGIDESVITTIYMGSGKGANGTGCLLMEARVKNRNQFQLFDIFYRYESE